MQSNDLTVAQWLEREDAENTGERLERIRWLTEQYPDISIQLFPDGQTSRSLFEEARYCFIYGQFLATILLGMAFIERSFAADLFAAGNDNFERANLTTLLREQHQRGFISQEQFDQLERARNHRNSLAHFRPPGHNETTEFRSVSQMELPYTLFEEDAKNILSIIFGLLQRWPFSI